MIFQKLTLNYPVKEEIISNILSKINAFRSICIEKIIPFKETGGLLSIAAFVAFVPYAIKITHQSDYQTKLSLNTNNPYVISQNIKSTEVVIGESEYDTNTRLQQEAAAAAIKPKISTPKVVYNDPSNFDEIYKAAGAQFNVPWKILKAVHYVETGCSGSTSKSSYAGARGPMQFMPGTWRAYGVDGNGDGVADMCNVVDAIYGAANLLAHSGAASGDVNGALFNYNHSQRYVDKVNEVASSIS